MIRYQAHYERCYARAASELLKRQKQRYLLQSGFESQKRASPGISQRKTANVEGRTPFPSVNKDKLDIQLKEMRGEVSAATSKPASSRLKTPQMSTRNARLNHNYARKPGRGFRPAVSPYPRSSVARDVPCRLSFTCLRHKLLYLAVLFWSASACRAQTWTLPLFTSDPHAVLTAAAAYGTSDELPSFLIDYSVAVSIGEDGRLTKTTRAVTKVLRVQAIGPAQKMTLAWYLDRDNKPVVKGRVITGDGKAHLLDESGMEEKGAPNPEAAGVYKLLYIKLPEVDIDSVVELEIQQSDKVPAVPGARFGSIEVPLGQPIVHFSASITSLGASDLHVQARSFPQAKVSPATVAKGHAYSVEASKFLAENLGPDLPPDVAPFPSVVFSNVPSWQNVAAWYSTVIDPAMPHQIKAGGGADRVATAEEAYEDVRKQVRHNSVDLVAPPVTPRLPADVIKAGSGDPVERALVLMNKLAQVGIASKLALSTVAPRADVKPDLPGIEAFNRALVYVDGPSPLWIDPVAEYSSVVRLPVHDQNRWALIIDPATSALVHTPLLSEKDNQESLVNEIRLGDGTPAKVTEVIEGSGSFADALGPLLKQLAEPDADQQKIVAAVFRGSGGQRVDTVKPANPQPIDKSRLEVDGEGYAASSVTDEGGTIEFPGASQLNFQSLGPLLAMNRDDPTQQLAPGRTADFYVAPPFTSKATYRAFPPPGYRFKDPAPLAPLNIGPISIVTATNLDKDGSFSVNYTLTQPKTQLTPSQVEAMRGEFRKVAAKNAIVRVDLENIANANLKAGDFREGITLLKKDADAAPDNINPSLRLASGYVAVGARSAAVDLCNDLLKRYTSPDGKYDAALEPKQAAIYNRIGWIYEHDEFGRMFAPGMDPVEAEKALRQAITMGYGSAALALADLFMYNSAGVHYGRGANLDSAIWIFDRTELNTVARAGRLTEYALLLLRAHKYDQLHQFFLYPQADSVDQSIKWAAFAASRSDSDMKQELDLSPLKPNDRHILLVEAGRHLIANRDYAGALRAFRFAGKGVGVSQSDMDRLARVKAFDEAAVSPQPAVAAFQRYAQAVLDADSSDGWKKFAAAENQNSTLAAQRYALLQWIAGLMGGTPPPEFWPYISDLINTTLTLAVDGTDATGFRLKASGGGNSQPITLAYVVKQDKDYLVAGLVKSDATSVQAATSARAGNTAAARQWLNWGREAAGRPPLSDLEFQRSLDVVSGERLLAEGKPGDAATILAKTHQADSADAAVSYLLAESLIQSNRLPEAKSLIDSLPSTAGATLRLRAHMSAQAANYPEAVEMEKQICARPDAIASDWNDLAWTTLFLHQNGPDAQTAAEKAAQMTNLASPAILHTLALAQANAGHLKDAVATAYKIAAVSDDPGEMQTIFGRIAEELGLFDAARRYYTQIAKGDNSSLSNYAFAHVRLAALPPATNPSKLSAKNLGDF